MDSPQGPASGGDDRSTPLTGAMPTSSEADSRPAEGVDARARRHPRAEHRHERMEVFEAAALAAEMETGRREETVEEARRSLVKRVARICAGLVVTGMGVLMLVLPGPGMLVVAAGLVILAQDVPFAARLLEKVRKRLPADADGKIPKHMIVSAVGVSLVAVAGSLWWTLLR
jgi:hypothetical protein